MAKEYQFEDGKELSFISLPKRSLESMSNNEIKNGIRYLWSNAYELKSEVTLPYTALIQEESRGREERRRNFINVAIALMALAVSVVSVWISIDTSKDTQQSIEISQEMLSSYKENFNIKKIAIEQENEAIKIELHRLRQTIDLKNKKAE